MRKLVLFILLLSGINCFAGKSSINQLSEVNQEWFNNPDGIQIASSEDFSMNKSYSDWIATHLKLVEQTLRQRTTGHLTSEQKRHRAQLLDELNGYWHSRAFPVNDYLTYKSPVFIDRTGNHCAVGFLMKQSGAESLALAIDADNKFVYVKDIKTKGVNEWAEKNGFTLEELAWIQPGYQVALPVEDMDKGLNGSVNTMVIDPASQVLYAGGTFTSSTNGVACNHVAAYLYDIVGWYWIGDGLNGTVNTLLIENNKLYVGGQFTMAGSLPVSNVAVYDLVTNQWQAMGNLDSAVNALVVYNNEIYAGGKFTGLVSKWTGSQWQDISQGFIYGEGVRTLEVYDNTLLIGGNFELTTGAFRKNVASYDGVYMGSSGFGTSTPVNDFEIHDDTLYAACDVVQGTDTCALAKFDTYTFTWECALQPYSLIMDYFSGTSIKHLLSADQRLFCAGTFFSSSGMTYGNNLMEFNTDLSGFSTCIPMVYVDSGIQCIIVRDHSICFGGDFINSTADTLNHIGILPNVLALGIVHPRQFSEHLEVFPNPSTGNITIDLKDFSDVEDGHVKILDATGKLVFNSTIDQASISIDLSSKNSAGIYLVQIQDGDGYVLATEKVVVE